ncbi:sulfurtransferase TusA family protein [Streptomyces sp. NPDC020731]|uniref:sulfurtransferase TusA family protein n=1 Tax=Streptomyces sp. NPDC020731 TaxID=3365085 RepID=UPI0037B02495
MGERRIRKMLRQMESGEPVRVTGAMATTTKLARSAAMARQFGYEYADVRQDGGPQGKQYVVVIVPDPTPEARARAARNRSRYPRAADGGELPRLAPEAVELLKARITFDITAMYTDRQRIVLAGVGAVPLALPVGLVLGSGGMTVVLTVLAWAAVMALLPVGFAVNRRFEAKYAALLRAAGFTPVTDPEGRLRYLPPGGRLPGHGSPFAG